MDKQKFEAILNGLLKHSREDKLNWKATANSYKYLLTLNDSSIVIESVGQSVNFEFKNEKGETVESMLSYPRMQNYDKCVQLYDLARRKALNSDETIDRILQQLGSDSIAA